MSAECSKCEQDLLYDGTCALCEAEAEVERLRAALQVIWDDAKLDALDMRRIARDALREKP